MPNTEQKINALKRTLNLMSRISRNIMTDDFEEIDCVNRAIRDAECDLFELELSLKLENEEDLIAA